MGAERTYKVEYAPLVYDDLDEILSYISTELHEPNAALNLIKTIETAIAALPAFPYKYPVTRDAVLATKGYRMLPIENFAIFYIVDEERHIVSLRRVLFGKRNFRWLL